jgi:hypothetical protein
MIPLEELNAALSFLITALIGFGLFYWIWQEYVIDSTRQQVFELRDELFDMAAAGQLDMNGEPYRMLRELFNASIRFAHHLNIWRLLVLMFTVKAVGERNVGRYAKHVVESVSSIEDPKIRARVSVIVEKQQMALALHVFKRSLLLMLAVPLALTILIMVLVSTDMIIRTFKKLSLLISASVSYSEQ